MGSIGLTELPGPALHGRTAENVVQKLVRHLEEDIVLGYLNPRERLAELGVEPATDTPAEFGPISLPKRNNGPTLRDRRISLPISEERRCEPAV